MSSSQNTDPEGPYKGGLALPVLGTRKIMRLNDEVQFISAESVLIMAKATELFSTLLAEDARDVVLINNKRTIKVEDMITAISRNQTQFEFLNTAFTGSTNPSKEDSLTSATASLSHSSSTAAKATSTSEPGNADADKA
jgi:histone H3/H4